MLSIPAKAVDLKESRVAYIPGSSNHHIGIVLAPWLAVFSSNIRLEPLTDFKMAIDACKAGSTDQSRFREWRHVGRSIETILCSNSQVSNVDAISMFASAH